MSKIKKPNSQELKSPQDIEAMATSGQILAETLHLLGQHVKAGTSTEELDQLAKEFIRGRGAEPTFLGYEGYPASVCASINEVVVHGIPSAHKLQDGDLISLDVGVTYEGWVADAAYTWSVGEATPEISRLLKGTQESLSAGISQCLVGHRVGDISRAVQRVLQSCDLGIVRAVVGHGVGRQLHEDPSVPNFGRPGKGPLLEEGMVIAIEPMATLGSGGVQVADDGWTTKTQDDSLAAHFEHTVAITGAGPRILTPWHLLLDA